MHDKQVNLGCVVACSLWLLTFLLIMAGTVVWLVVDSDEVGVALMALGLAFSASAATMTIRQFFVRQNRLLRDAFELGRESRDDPSSGVRRLTR